MSPKERFQIFLEPDQLRRLRHVEGRIGVAVSEQIRRGVEMWLETDVFARKALKDFKEGRPSPGAMRVAAAASRSRSR